MSSNPFRRKVSDGNTPSASTRTSFDIDERRIQQAAENAFGAIDAPDATEPLPSLDIPTSRVDLSVDAISRGRDAQVPDAPVRAGEGRSSTETSPEKKKSTTDEPRRPTAPSPNSTSSPPPPPRHRPTSNSHLNLNSNSNQASPPAPPSIRASPSHSAPPPPPPRPRRSVKRPKTENPPPEPQLEIKPVAVNIVPASPTSDPFVETPIENVAPSLAAALEAKPLQPPQPLREFESSSDEADIPTRITQTNRSQDRITFTVEPQEMEDEPNKTLILQDPNPFRKKDDHESAPSPQRRSLDMDESSRPHVRFGVQRSNSGYNSKTGRQSLDVDAFKHLMLTGQTVYTPDSTSTEASNLSKQSLLESVAEHTIITPRSSQETSRTSHEISGEEDERTKYAASLLSSSTKQKPLPPKPRGQRISIQAVPAPKPAAPTVLSDLSTSPPNPQISPINRRHSSQIPSTENLHDLHYTTSMPLSQSNSTVSLPLPPPPPPPPSRRIAPYPQMTSSISPPYTPDETPPSISLSSTSPARKPEPPPTRRSSKRMSAPPGRLQAYAETGKYTATLPPPPPIRKKSYLSQSATEGDDADVVVKTGGEEITI